MGLLSQGGKWEEFTMAYRAGDIVIVICHRIGTGYPGLAAFASIRLL